MCFETYRKPLYDTENLYDYTIFYIIELCREYQQNRARSPNQADRSDASYT